MDKKKQLILSIVGIIGLILITVGVTYAFFSYLKNGSKENSITSGEITFLYTEENRSISITDAMPIFDTEGKKLDNYFDFKVT